MELDDTFPFIKNENFQLKSVLSKCNTSQHYEFIINLIEKGIFILYNSSSLQLKSNPAVEIYHLTGWIPEILCFAEITNKANLWQKLLTNFNEGNIMVCLGSGQVKDPILFSKEYPKIISKSTSNL